LGNQQGITQAKLKADAERHHKDKTLEYVKHREQLATTANKPKERTE
jgi:hypothetical protein